MPGFDRTESAAAQAACAYHPLEIPAPTFRERRRLQNHGRAAAWCRSRNSNAYCGKAPAWSGVVDRTLQAELFWGNWQMAQLCSICVSEPSPKLTAVSRECHPPERPADSLDSAAFLSSRHYPPARISLRLSRYSFRSCRSAKHEIGCRHLAVCSGVNFLDRAQIWKPRSGHIARDRAGCHADEPGEFIALEVFFFQPVFELHEVKLAASPAIRQEFISAKESQLARLRLSRHAPGHFRYG